VKINQDDLVLEVGSGDKPYPRADVLLDKSLIDSSERESRKSLVIDRPMVVGDAEALPFADRAFDYIIASHVLEHARDPAKFLDELARVGKRGYIETPLPLRERVFDWSFHRWYVDQEGQELLLIKKTARSKQFYLGMTLTKRKKLYGLDGKKLLNLGLEWKGKIKYRVINQEPINFLRDLDKKLVDLETSGNNGQAKEKNLLAKEVKDYLFWVKLGLKNRLQSCRRKKVDIFSLIVCPACKGNLKKGKTKLNCSKCDRQYRLLEKKIPQLLI
jgi:SAM-dependent methyltransferase